MSDNEANSTELVFELEDDDEVVFDGINDHDCGLHAENRDSVRGGGTVTKNGNPKQKT